MHLVGPQDSEVKVEEELLAPGYRKKEGNSEIELIK